MSSSGKCLGLKNIRGASSGRLGRKARLKRSVWLFKQPECKANHTQLVPEFLWDVSAEDLFVLTKFCKVERTGARAGWKWLWTLCWLA